MKKVHFIKQASQSDLRLAQGFARTWVTRAMSETGLMLYVWWASCRLWRKSPKSKALVPGYFKAWAICIPPTVAIVFPATIPWSSGSSRRRRRWMRRVLRIHRRLRLEERLDHRIAPTPGCVVQRRAASGATREAKPRANPTERRGEKL